MSGHVITPVLFLCRCLYVVPLAAVLLLAASSVAAADGIDIPVALQVQLLSSN